MRRHCSPSTGLQEQGVCQERGIPAAVPHPVLTPHPTGSAAGQLLWAQALLPSWDPSSIKKK